MSSVRNFVIGGVLVAGAAGALAIMSYNSLREELRQTSAIAHWSVIKDTDDSALVTGYLQRYPETAFTQLAQAKLDALKGNSPMLAMQRQLDEMKAKAQAEADKLIADAKTQAEKAQSDATRIAELAKSEQLKADAAKVEALRATELAKAEATEATKVAKAEATKAAELAKAETAKAAAQTKMELAKAEQAKAEAAKAAQLTQAAQAAQSAKIAAVVPVPVPAPAPAAQPRPQQASAPAAASVSGPATGAAAFVVIASTAEGLKKGDRVGASQTLAVPAGTRIVLMDGNGKVMTVRGPFNGAAGGGEGSGLIGRLSEALSTSEVTTRKMGVFRGVAPGLGLSGAAAMDPWTIDATSSGNWCVAPDRAINLTGGSENVSIEMLPSGPKMDVAWPRNRLTVQWPASVPVKAGATYQLRTGGKTSSMVLHISSAKSGTPGQTALWMADKGCQQQAAAMIDSLERGMGGRLFDLEIGADRVSGVYKVGEELKLSVRPSREAYVYCFYRDVAGETTKIYPSQFETSARIGDGAQSIPAPSWESPMQLTGPAGGSEVRCFATDRDASAQLPAEIAKPGFNVLSKQVAGSLMDVFKRPDGNLATATMQITVKE